MGFLLYLNLTIYISIIKQKSYKKSRSKNIIVPAGTVALLKEMFTSNDGLDLSAIIQDLSVETDEDLVAINLGLLLNNKVLEVPQKVYTFGTNKGQMNRVYVRVKTGHSLLKDVVNYTYYTFELDFDIYTDEEHGVVVVHGNSVDLCAAMHTCFEAYKTGVGTTSQKAFADMVLDVISVNFTPDQMVKEMDKRINELI